MIQLQQKEILLKAEIGIMGQWRNTSMDKSNTIGKEALLMGITSNTTN